MTRAWIQRQPVWLTVGGCALAGLSLTVGSLVGVVMPVQRSEAAAKQSVAELDTAESAADQLQREAEALTKRLAAREVDLAATPVKLGDRRELNQRVADLIALAQESGLEVFTLQPGLAEAAEHYRVVPLRLEAGGSFGRQLAFMDQLHTVFPDVRVADVKLETRPREAQPRPSVVMGLRWFTALDDGAATAFGRAGASGGGK